MPQAQLQLARSYTPFGEELTSSGEGVTTVGFTGEMLDPSGLQYLRARYYAPQVGRFISTDPLDRLGAAPFTGYNQYPASLNPYQYGYNNPLVYVDPSGKVGVAIPLIIFGGGVISAGASALSQYMKYGNWNCVDWNEVAIAGVVGMVGTGLGMLAGFGIATVSLGFYGSLGLSVLYGTAIGEGIYAFDRGLHGEKYEFSVRRAATNAVIAAVTFGVGYGAVKALSAIKPKVATSAAAEAVTEEIEVATGSIDDTVDAITEMYTVNGESLTAKEFANLRRQAVKKAWKQEQSLVSETGVGTRNWTPGETLCL